MKETGEHTKRLEENRFRRIRDNLLWYPLDHQEGGGEREGRETKGQDQPVVVERRSRESRKCPKAVQQGQNSRS
jgi:hypothetical protein